MNEAADERARAVALAYQKGGDIPSGPGWSAACEPAVDALVSPSPDELAVDEELELEPAGAEVGELREDEEPTLFALAEDEAQWHTLTLELSADEHDRLIARARAEGISPEELLRSLI